MLDQRWCLDLPFPIPFSCLQERPCACVRVLCLWRVLNERLEGVRNRKGLQTGIATEEITIASGFAQVSTLFESFADLWEGFKYFLPHPSLLVISLLSLPAEFSHFFQTPRPRFFVGSTSPSCSPTPDLPSSPKYVLQLPQQPPPCGCSWLPSPVENCPRSPML